MKKKLPLLSFFLCIGSLSVAQAPSQAWERTFNGAGSSFDAIKFVRLDADKNVYVTGRAYSGNSTQTDVLTIKYDSAGTLLWQHTYNDADYNLGDEPYDMEIAPNGDAIIVGRTEMPGGFPPNAIGFVYALNGATGNPEWSHEFMGPGSGGGTVNIAKKVVISAAGDIHVTGSYMASGGTIMMFLAKYDAAGTELWMQTIDDSTDPNTRVNDGTNVALDSSGNIYISGATALLTTWYDLALWKLSPTGTQLWLETKAGPTNGTSESQLSVIVDASGNAYTYGVHSGEKHRIIKYDAAGAEQWTLDLDTVNAWYSSSYTGADEHMTFDNDGNVLVALGVSGSFGQKIGVVKITPAGAITWFRLYGGTGLYTNEVYQVLVDGANNILFTGALSNAGSSTYDLGVFKVDTNGDLFWTIIYSGPANGTDKGHSLALGTAGAVYVGGTGAGATNGDYYLVKYQDGAANGLGAETAEVVFALQPNPADDQVHVRFSDAAGTPKTLLLRDAMGRQAAPALTTAGDACDLDLSTLRSGVYILQVRTTAGYGNYRIVVQ